MSMDVWTNMVGVFLCYFFFLCLRGESNLYYDFRKVVSYPLDDGDILIFFRLTLKSKWINYSLCGGFLYFLINSPGVVISKFFILLFASRISLSNVSNISQYFNEEARIGVSFSSTNAINFLSLFFFGNGKMVIGVAPIKENSMFSDILFENFFAITFLASVNTNSLMKNIYLGEFKIWKEAPLVELRAETNTFVSIKTLRRPLWLFAIEFVKSFFSWCLECWFILVVKIRICTIAKR